MSKSLTEVKGLLNGMPEVNQDMLGDKDSEVHNHEVNMSTKKDRESEVKNIYKIQEGLICKLFCLRKLEPGMVLHTCNLRNWENEAGQL